MIDMEKARKAFDEYALEYITRIENGDIEIKKDGLDAEKQKEYTLNAVKLKINHMLRVANASRSIAQRLELSDEDVKLAELIGLLHDIGRFEQLRVYHTFDDTKSIRHDLYSVVQLFTGDKIIKRFVDVGENDKVDPEIFYIISRAIYNHGKKEVDERDFQDTDEMDPTTSLFCKIIRDADKTDIYYQCVNGNPYVVFNGARGYEAKVDPSTGKKFVPEGVNPNVFRAFMEHRIVDNNDVKTQVDDIVRKFAFVYDFNFSESLEEVLQEGYIPKMLARFKESFILTDEAIRTIEAVAYEAERYIREQMEKKELLHK